MTTILKNKINLWQEFAEKTNGVFKEGHSWTSDSVEIEYQNWKIVFDNFTLWSGKYSSEVTRIIAPIILKENFRFEIYSEGFIRKIEKLFESQDIQIAYPEFDKAFIIKSNNEFKIKTLLQNKAIRNSILTQKGVNLVISDRKGIWEEKLPENEFELSYFVSHKIQNMETLKSLLLLFKSILNQLHQMDSIA